MQLVRVYLQLVGLLSFDFNETYNRDPKIHHYVLSYLTLDVKCSGAVSL